MTTKTHSTTLVTEQFTDQEGNFRTNRVNERLADETFRLRTLADTVDPTKEFTVMRNIVVRATKTEVVHELRPITVRCTSMREAGWLADQHKAMVDVPIPRTRERD